MALFVWRQLANFGNFVHYTSISWNGCWRREMTGLSQTTKQTNVQHLRGVISKQTIQLWYLEMILYGLCTVHSTEQNNLTRQPYR